MVAGFSVFWRGSREAVIEYRIGYRCPIVRFDKGREPSSHGELETKTARFRSCAFGDHRRGVEESAAAGVQLHLTGLVASPAITIYEAIYENPPENADHCPATHTEVRIHPDGATTRLALYYPGPITQAAPTETA